MKQNGSSETEPACTKEAKKECRKYVYVTLKRHSKSCQDIGCQRNHFIIPSNSFQERSFNHHGTCFKFVVKMTLKRKLENDDNRLSRKRRKLAFAMPPSVKGLRHRGVITIDSLPNEILLHVFTFLNVYDLNERVIPVCKKWSTVAKTSTLWHTIKAGPEVPTATVIKWLEIAGRNLKTLKIKRRNDAEEVLHKVELVSTLLRGCIKWSAIKCRKVV